MTVVDAPASLIPLIDGFAASLSVADPRAKVSAYYELYQWHGWQKHTRYLHGDFGVAMVWRSLKVVRRRGDGWEQIT